MSRSVKRLLKKARHGDLDSLLASTVELAHETQDQELERWAKLELHGFYTSNPVMTDDIEVPSYRAIPGQWMDHARRPLVITDPSFSFLNEIRVRHGVVDLQEMSTTSGLIALEMPELTASIRKNLEVEVHYFTFTSMAVRSVLASIRTQLQDRLRTVAQSPVQGSITPHRTSTGQDIFILRPTIHGLGVDLRALWRWISGRKGG